MAVQPERGVDPALQRVFHDEIEAVEAIEFVTRDGAAKQVGVGGLDAFGGQPGLERFIVARIVDPDADAERIALVASARSLPNG
jgi:hypothetical protein